METMLNFVVSFLNFEMNKIRCFFNILFNPIKRVSQSSYNNNFVCGTFPYFKALPVCTRVTLA